MSLNLICPINQSGYGRASYEICKALIRANINVSLFPIGGRIEDGLICPEIQTALSNAETYDKNANCVRLFHQFSLAEFVGKGSHIGFPIFELDTFKPIELHHLKSCDSLLVCSEWAKKICRTNGIDTPIEVVNLGVDTHLFCPKPLITGPTRFLNIGKWEIRKGHDVLIKAFQKAFTSTDNVELIMCCTNWLISQEESKKWEKLYQNPKVRIVSRLPNHSDVARLMQMVDCGVFPARAEGWNLEALEVLACGREIIITDYSAHKEFCSNSRLIPIDRVEPAIDNIWFHGQGNWAHLGDREIDIIAQHMREVHESKQSGKLSVNNRGVEIAKNLSWDNTARKIINLCH